MEYTINKLARLANISTRTLRYYDEIDLLKPAKINSSGYRIYGRREVDILQQILFYRELDIELDKIKQILSSKEYNVLYELKLHKIKLLKKKDLLSKLLVNLDNTINKEEGRKVDMEDKEKFIGFKQNLVNENETKYGKEINEKYGEKTIKKANEKFMNLTKEEYDTFNKLNVELLDKLKEAVEKNNTDEKLAKEIFDKYKQWLLFSWSEYSAEAHIGLGEMYVADERFKKYYDVSGENAAEILRDIIKKYAK